MQAGSLEFLTEGLEENDLYIAKGFNYSKNERGGCICKSKRVMVADQANKMRSQKWLWHYMTAV